MIANEYDSTASSWLELPPASNMVTMLSPGDDDDAEDEDGDWSDIDDEDFEDMAEDLDDLHVIELDNDIFDAEDDDHLPDDDMQ